MKRPLAAVMAMLMLCALCACGAKEATPFQMKKEKGNDGYTCEGFKKQSSIPELVIPGTYNGKTVQYVGYSAFSESDMVRLTISEGVEGLRDYAFRDCTRLEAVSLPKSLTKLGGAFGGCTSLKEIYIPEGVTDLEMWAFVDCSALETVVIEGQLDTLGRESFKDCTSLKVIYLPETLTKIHPGALDGCDALEEIHFAGTVEEFLNIDFTWDWMSAKNVLVCCADNDILMEGKSSWEYSDQWVRYPRDPMEALSSYEDWSDPGPDETMPEAWSDPGPDETMPEAWDSTVTMLPPGFSEFTSDYVACDVDEFAMYIAQCDFASAARYLHPDLLDALGGDITKQFADTENIFLSGAIGYDPQYSFVGGSEYFNDKYNTWARVMDSIRQRHDELGINIDFDEERVKQYNYTFGKVTDIRDKFANLTVYAEDSVILYFSYVVTN